MGARWRYLLAELGIGLRRNLLMTVATIVTFTVSLTLLGVGILVQRQVDRVTDLFYGEVEVSIFLVDGITEDQRSSLERELRGHPVVEDVLYESKEDAYEHFQEIFADNESLLESVTPEILPASFRVKLHDPEQFAVIESQFAGYPGVDVVSDQREILNRFFALLGALRNGSLWIAAIQIVGAAALIFNTVRVTAFARREQTGMMKLVGATNWYIRLPFLLEGVVAGVVSALLAGGFLVLGSFTILQRIQEQVEFLPVVGLGDVLAVFPLLIGVAVMIAALSAFLSLRRFLAV
jgi:cell division transport system permease protein